MQVNVKMQEQLTTDSRQEGKQELSLVATKQFTVEESAR
jgi:hypothetical protein